MLFLYTDEYSIFFFLPDGTLNMIVGVGGKLLFLDFPKQKLNFETLFTKKTIIIIQSEMCFYN